MTKRPILRGVVMGKQIVVYCPNCDAWHLHGWVPGTTKPSHRAAHCSTVPDIFEQTGYYVAPFRRSDLLVINHGITKNPA